MLRDITIGQYFPGDSPIHRLDPRTKILFTILFMVLVFCVQTYTGYMLLGILMLGVMRLTAVPLKFFFKGMRTLLFLMLFTGLINLFLTDGNVVCTIPYVNWSITDAGIRMAVFMVFRLVYLIAGTSVLTFTTAPMSLTDGIERLLRPLQKIKVPAHEIAMMMSIALRFIPTLTEETDKIMKAQAARGADFESGNIAQRAKAMVPILVPLFISAFRRADELAIAMECRCYRGGKNRTSMKQLRFARLDLAALCGALVFVAAVLAGNLGEIWQITNWF